MINKTKSLIQIQSYIKASSDHPNLNFLRIQ